MKSIPSSVWFLGSLLLGTLFIGILVLNANDQIKGDIKLPIEVVEYFDYRCSHCAQAIPLTDEIENSFGDKVKLIHKHYPIPVGQNSLTLAYGAEAAREQDKFEEYHDETFSREIAYLNGQLEDTQIDPFLIAEFLGLDMEKFAADFESVEIIDRVLDSKEQGSKLGVTGTPTFFVEGQRVSSVQLSEVVSSFIDAAEQNEGN